MKSLLLLAFMIISINTLTQSLDNSMVFNGSSDYYQVNDNSSLDLSSNFTIEVWINPCDTTGYRAILTKSRCDISTRDYAYYLGILDGKLRWIWDNDGSCNNTPNIYESSARIIRNNMWQHIAIVQTSIAIKMYYNGVLISGRLVSGSSYSSINNSSEPLRIGVYQANYGVFSCVVFGRVEGGVIWNKTFTPAQIFSNYTTLLKGTEA
jgi:hypothetical protein